MPARGIRHSLVLSLTTLCLCLSLLVSTHRTVWAQKDIPSEVNSLIEELKDPNEDVRARAASALEEFGPEAKAEVPPLIGALKDEDEGVRSRAARALGNIGPEAKAAVPALVEALKDEADDVRQEAAEALGKIDPEAKATVSALIEALKDTIKNRRVKIVLVKANICRLLEEPLMAAGFNVINNGAIVPFPSHGQQPNFHKNIKKVLKRMNLNRITETDLFGTFHLRVPGGDKYAGYYSSLDAIRPLLNSEEWKENVTGFYLNVAGDFDGVRISYWTTSPERTQQTVDEFVAEHGLEYIRNPSTPVQTRNSQQYGGEELRFRRFLATYTQIGLDIMEADLLNARRLFATFRLQVMIGRQPYKPHFIGTFENHSPFYNNLSDAEKDQFWLDIAHWPNPPQVDWAHMMVNMVLGCDWNQIFQQASIAPLPPLSISEINQIIRNQGFQIPKDWQPIEPQT